MQLMIKNQANKQTQIRT